MEGSGVARSIDPAMGNPTAETTRSSITDGLQMVSSSSASLSGKEQHRSLDKYLPRPQDQVVAQSVDHNGISVDLNDDSGKRRARKVKHKQREQQQSDEEDANVASTLQAYKLEEWMTSSEEDECSDMISVDYSRQQQRESFFDGQQLEEDEVIINMMVVIGSHHSDFSVDDGDDDRDDWSSLSSYNSLAGRDSGMDDILSDSDHGPTSVDRKMLGESHRTEGSAQDNAFLFLPVTTPPSILATVSPENQRHMVHTPHDVEQLVLGDDVDGDESENDADVDDSMRQHGSKRSIEFSPTRRKTSRKNVGSSRSPNILSSPSKKEESKGRRVSPLWSRSQLPYASNHSSESESENVKEIQSGDVLISGKEHVKKGEETWTESIVWSSPTNKQNGHSVKSSPDAFFSPESQGRTFLPKRFQSSMDSKLMNPSLHHSLSGSAGVEPPQNRNRITSIPKSAWLLSTVLDENGKRPAFMSNIEYTAPLIDKSELPTTRTKKSLNRKRSISQPATTTTSQEQKARNNSLLDNLLRTSKDEEHAQLSFADESSSRQSTVGSNRVRSVSVGLDPQDDFSIGRASISKVSVSTDDSDDYSIMSEISADSIHRNVRVKRTTRKKKVKKAKPVADAEAVSGTDGNCSSSVNGSSELKKKKAIRKARPKKRGRKEEYQQSPGDFTHDNKIIPGQISKHSEESTRRIEERVDAIFNNKDLIYSDLEKKLLEMSTNLQPHMQEEPTREKPKSMRIKSKAHPVSLISEKGPVSLRLLDRSRARNRSRSQSRSRESAAAELKAAPESRSRSKSMDPSESGDRRTSTTRMRGKKTVAEVEEGVRNDLSSNLKHEKNDIQRGSKITSHSERLSHTVAMSKGFAAKASNASEAEVVPESSRILLSDSGSVNSLTSLTNMRKRKGIRSDSKRALQANLRTESLPLEFKGKNTSSPASFGTLRAKLSSAVFLRRDKPQESVTSHPSNNKQPTETAVKTDTEIQVNRSKKTQSKNIERPESETKPVTGGLKARKEGQDGKRKDLKSPNAGKRPVVASACLSPLPRQGTETPVVTKKRSPKVAAGLYYDKDIEEALQRHNLGSTVSTLVLGSPLPSPNGKSKKDIKKNRQQSDKQVVIQEDFVYKDSKSSVAPTKGDRNGEEVDESVDFPRRLKALRNPSHRHSIGSVDDSMLLGSQVDGGEFADGDVECLRVEVKRKKKQMKQQISEIRSQTEEDILNMEQELADEKVALRQKLMSLGAGSDPAEGLKYLCSCKVARLHEEGKSLKKEMENLESEIAEQVALTNELIRESLDIQRKTQEVVAEISRAELENARYASAMDTLRMTHASLSRVLEEDETHYQEDGRSFVSNFVPQLEDKEYVALKQSLRKFDGDDGTS